MNRTIHEVAQGSPEWLALRSQYFTASEAPAAMGESKYQSRNDLLKQKSTGLSKDVDAATQRLFNAGHEAEAAARPIIEAQIHDDLYPVTVSIEIDGLKLLASMDGMTMDETIGWECKLYNKGLETQVLNEEIDPHYYWQLEHQMLVSGCEKIIFTTSDGTPEHTTSFTYTSLPERRAKLIKGWGQFATDLASYVPQEVIPAAAAAPIADLPALNIQISGSVVASNLAQWKDVVIARIGDISTDLQTDTDFATAESTVKFLDDGERRIDLVKAQAQSQASDIDTIFRAMDEIKAMMRSKRLELDKLVKARKESIRAEIVNAGRTSFDSHMATLIRRVGNHFGTFPAPYFADAIKGKRTIQSLRDAVDTELARAKIAASEFTDRIEINQRTLREMAAEYPMLMKHEAQLILKQHDDMVAQIKSWIFDFKEAERQRAEAAERARIEEERKAQAAACAANEAQPPSNPPTPLPESGAPVAAIQPSQQPVAVEAQADDEPAIWRNAKQSIVVMLDALTISELNEVASFINRKAWRKAA